MMRFVLQIAQVDSTTTNEIVLPEGTTPAEALARAQAVTLGGFSEKLYTHNVRFPIGDAVRFYPPHMIKHVDLRERKISELDDGAIC